MNLNTNKPSCASNLEPCVFRNSNKCVKCGRHRAPSFAVGKNQPKTAALTVQI